MIWVLIFWHLPVLSPFKYIHMHIHIRNFFMIEQRSIFIIDYLKNNTHAHTTALPPYSSCPPHFETNILKLCIS